MAKRWPGRLISGLAGSWSLRIPRARHSRSLRARRTTEGDRVLAHFTSDDVTNAKRPIGRVSKDPAIGASTVTEPTLPQRCLFPPLSTRRGLSLPYRRLGHVGPGPGPRSSPVGAVVLAA